MANGVVLYRGASMIDGAPIVVIATGLEADSRNAKTGNLIQTWIMREDMNPVAAANGGADSSVCGDCKHRGVISEAIYDGVVVRKNSERSCYVQLGRAPLNIWRTYHKGRYPSEWDSETFQGRIVRLGAYGDPAAVPFGIWERVLRLAASHTGYTHQWRRFPELAQYVMASCDTVEERVHAKFLGYRTFRVQLKPDAPLSREIACPASKEAGKKTVCALCKACGGNAAKAKADIVIAVHPAGHVKAFTRALERLAA